MGSSLWQWSSGHKSKRAHKHHMTDGREDSFGQGGRDGEREMKWDRERGRRTEAEERSQAGLLSLMESLKCWIVYECPWSMSAVKAKTRNHGGGDSLQLMSNKNNKNECGQASVNSQKNAKCFVQLLQETYVEVLLRQIINVCSLNWEHDKKCFMSPFGELVGELYVTIRWTLYVTIRWTPFGEQVIVSHLPLCFAYMPMRTLVNSWGETFRMW